MKVWGVGVYAYSYGCRTVHYHSSDACGYMSTLTHVCLYIRRIIDNDMHVPLHVYLGTYCNMYEHLVSVHVHARGCTQVSSNAFVSVYISVCLCEHIDMKICVPYHQNY